MPDVVARVAGYSVTRAELNRYTQYAATFDSVVYPGSSEARCSQMPEAAACNRFRAEVLARLIQETTILRYARRHHMVLSDADKVIARRQLDQLMAPGAPTARLFRLGVSKRFVSQVVERQLLIQKVEEQVAGVRARTGPELHIRKIGIPSSGNASTDVREVMSIASGGKVPAGAAERTEWMAPFRMKPDVRRALSGVRRGDFVGPFSRPGYVLVVQLLGRAVHTYSAPAHAMLTSKLFRKWLQAAVRAARPECERGSRHLHPCPASMMKAA
jgi:hypothetical protein